MATFSDLLTATEEGLIRIFHRIKPAPVRDFIVRIDWAAAQLQLNHTQLVCALGFNRHMPALPEILSIIGLASFRLLSYRRDELFTSDDYKNLTIENVLDLYSASGDDPALLATLRDLLAPRLAHLEGRIGYGADAAFLASYKMEVNGIYNGGLATREFAERRLQPAYAACRLITEEVRLMVRNALLPPSNVFYLDEVLAEEKASLIDDGLIPAGMVRNRLDNGDIGDDERQILERYT